MESRKPDTRARTSTVFIAAKRPVYSSHSVIFFCTGTATVTAGGAGAELAAGLPSQPSIKKPAHRISAMSTVRDIDANSAVYSNHTQGNGGEPSPRPFTLTLINLHDSLVLESV